MPNFRSLKIADPCSESWDEMSGNERVRFCSHCSKHVNDLSAATRKDALRLVKRANGNICIRYRIDPVTQQPVFVDTLVRITRRAPSLAAGVVGATLGLSALTYAQGAPAATSHSATRTAAIGTPAAGETSSKSSGTLYGTVFDPNGAVVVDASITLVRPDDSILARRVTDSVGNYSFNEDLNQPFRIVVNAVGFESEHGTYEYAVAPGATLRHDITLDVGDIEIMVGGVVSVDNDRDPIFAAVWEDDAETVKHLLTSGTDIEILDTDGDTPLMNAVFAGSVEVTRVLLDYGADVNAVAEDGTTPVMRMDSDSTPELAQMLIDAGASLFAENEEGDTALTRAARDVSPEILELLIRAGADVNHANKQGTTALMNAAYDENIDNVRLLLIAGANVNAADEDGETAWDKTSDEDIEELLVAYGARVPPEEYQPDEEPDDDDPQ